MLEQEASSPTAQERRREQNRLAQRRFRQRRNASGTQRTTRTARASRNTSCEDDLETQSRDHSVAASTIPTNVPNQSNNNSNKSGINPSQDAEAFPFDDLMDFNDSLITLTTPDMASSLVSSTTSSKLQNAAGPLSGCSTWNDPSLALDTRPFEFDAARLDTPLHMAAQGGSEKIVQLLLQHGADCNARGVQSMMPLAHAVIGNHENVVDILLSHGAQILAVDDQQRSALHLAVVYRRERILKTLVHHCGKHSDVLDVCDMEGNFTFAYCNQHESRFCG